MTVLTTVLPLESEKGSMENKGQYCACAGLISYQHGGLKVLSALLCFDLYIAV